MDPDPARNAGNKDDNVGPASPPSDPQQISSDPEPDADDWDDEQLQRTLRDKDKDRDKDRDKSKTSAEIGEKIAFPSSKDEAESLGGSLQLGDVDWDDINNEVDAAMNESDDEDQDGKSDRSMRSGNVSENEDWTDETNSMISSTNSTPRKSRKRLRSTTPSEHDSRGGTPDADILRSPLAKRKKLALERSGNSRLKEAFTASDLPVANSTPEIDKASRASSVSRNGADDDGDEDSDEDGGEFALDLDDDFLARELGEDWG